MSNWVVPRTWTAGAVLTAADLDAEVRDPETWLKSALDNITAGTASDEFENHTYLDIRNDDAGLAGPMIRGWREGGDAAMFQIATNGWMEWGSGEADVPMDVSIRREEARILALLNSQFRIYRDDNQDPAVSARITGEGFARASMHAGFFELLEGSDPGAGNTDRVRWYARNSGGKQQLVARWEDGTSTVIAEQP